MTKSDPAPLTSTQRQIMEVVWERGEATVSDVREALNTRRRKLARNTVQTMMARLEDKGWLTHREHGRTFVYAARVPRSVSLGARVAQLVDRFFAGSPEDMVTALIEYRGLSQQESQRIRAMIEAAETGKKSPKRGKQS